MKPSFPQKPPLLVRASTCSTTWEEAVMRLVGWAARSQVPGALPRSQGLCPAPSAPWKGSGSLWELKGLGRQVEGTASQQPATELQTQDVFPEHPLLCAGCWGQRLRPQGEAGLPGDTESARECGVVREVSQRRGVTRLPRLGGGGGGGGIIQADGESGRPRQSEGQWGGPGTEMGGRLCDTEHREVRLDHMGTLVF